MNPLSVVFGAVLAGSYFLPWLNVPGGFTPSSLPIEPTMDFLRQTSPLLLTFLGTFALGALVALLSLFGARVRLLTLLAALLPFGVAGYALWNVSDVLQTYGMPPITGNDLSQIADAIKAVAGTGFYAWFAGAGGLFLAYLFSPESP